MGVVCYTFNVYTLNDIVACIVCFLCIDKRDRYSVYFSMNVQWIDGEGGGRGVTHGYVCSHGTRRFDGRFPIEISVISVGMYVCLPNTG